MTTSAVAARLITDLIIGVKNPYQKVFTPERFSKAALSGISKEIFHSARGLIRQNLVIPEKTLESIPVGHGGIVKYQGKKVGVYRQSAQEYHVVDTECPHLGCRLEFNPDEKTWDCPCHGSRFTRNGRLIDNPATTGKRK
jgi:Rieske Fe-S protein